MRIIIVEPLLKNRQGHIFFYLQAMTSELKRRCIPYFIFGNLSADGDILKMGNFFPFFSEITVAILKIGILPKGILLLPGLIRKFRDQLLDALIDNPALSLQDGDIIFSLSTHVFEFAVLAWFLRAKGKTLAAKGCRVIIGFNFSCIRNSRILTIFLSFAYRMICKHWIDKSCVRIAYFSSGELTKKEFERRLHKKVSFFPTPVYPLPLGIGQVTGEGGDKDKIMVSYLGGARYNKGFDIYVRMIDRLSKEGDIARKVSFLAQVDIHEQQSKKDIKLVSGYMLLLESLIRKSSNISAVYGTLSSLEYYKLLIHSDIVVLPYRDRVYHNCASNIFLETIIAGRIPIVPSSTAMAAELSRYQLEDLIFQNGDLEDLAKVVKRSLTGYNPYRDKIRRMQADYAEFHSADNLINALLNA